MKNIFVLSTFKVMHEKTWNLQDSTGTVSIEKRVLMGGGTVRSKKSIGRRKREAD